MVEKKEKRNEYSTWLPLCRPNISRLQEIVAECGNAVVRKIETETHTFYSLSEYLIHRHVASGDLSIEIGNKEDDYLPIIEIDVSVNRTLVSYKGAESEIELKSIYKKFKIECIKNISIIKVSNRLLYFFAVLYIIHLLNAGIILGVFYERIKILIDAVLFGFMLFFSPQALERMVLPLVSDTDASESIFRRNIVSILGYSLMLIIGALIAKFLFPLLGL